MAEERGARAGRAPACAACRSGRAEGARLGLVVVEGRAISLCRPHAAHVASAMPQTFEELRALFRGEGVFEGGPDRRSPIARRSRDDRRIFLRLEGRRAHPGRRKTDPRD